ncbi:hypothetical protein RHSIM_Rhsim13G0199000 [Rhododendron simsii]|uniref:Retroviral polymerase SH3-like domain-containing protein n=1 Tax=Rhododendron simsii TaxID=118357 RepID=A0A834L5G4_RHOSS|nr:hypothetical protein RHSIM_Rhsim13G0199000 [Rhododendron simsii]
MMGYTIYNPVTQKVIFSRDVIFEENESWSWDQTEVTRNMELEEKEQEQPSPQKGEPSSPVAQEFLDMRPKNTRSLDDLYQNTDPLDADFTMLPCREDRVQIDEGLMHGIPELTSTFRRMDSRKCPYEHALYMTKETDGNQLYVCLYVDDFIFTGNNPTMFDSFILMMQREDGIFISQAGYAKNVLKHFGMEKSNPMTTPVESGVQLRKSEVGDVDSTYFKSLVGSLLYLTCTRPDILYRVGLIIRYMDTPDQSYLNAAKRILRYVIGKINDGLFYTSTKDFNLVGYFDSDWGRDLEET